ncbi:hypothetical protein ACO0K3_17340 [Undibacterium sp. Rencai35W]|uniref:hypothetical protein n=1 Tax=Undibacterium sp. Rencai35W TaxID=3413046 RepID=UPI003BF0317C
MRHVVGLSSAKDQELRWPLDVENRMRFDSGHFQTLGYFRLLALAFDHYAQRDARIGISSINVMFYLDGEDLVATLEILLRLENEIADMPERWKTFLGTVQYPGRQPKRIEPLLFKRRAMALLGSLRALTQKAMDQGKMVVYGNGVCYRYLCGIKLPPGTVEYS